MSMTKAELTAENKPACESRSYELVSDGMRWVTHEYQGGVEVFVVLLDIIHIVVGRLPLVNRIEIESRIVGLDGLKKRSESVLKATFPQRPAILTMWRVERTTLGQFAVAEILFHSSCPLESPPFP
jgi:hypothetical protein